jgi:pyruvate kinase
MKQTKIVASISDRRCEVDFIRDLYEAGMNVVRMNTAHATPDGIKTIIKNVRTVSNQIGILIDTKGPEVRTTGCEDPIPYKTGERVKIVGRPEQDTAHDIICVSYPNFVNDVHIGSSVLFDDGELEMKVVDKDEDYLIVEVQNDGALGSHKSVNVPGARINLPALTEKDRHNILLAIDQDIDFIAHSFVRNKEDILEVQDILNAHQSNIKIISKIENQEGVDNIDEIIDVSYGIMIARGDLGIEVPIERIPGIQRQIIRKCVLAKKPVIVATQMLHSMINNPRPTRAEVTDIANAIYYRTDCLMLSGETASGKYPVEAVRTMASVAEQAEKDKMRENDIPIPLSKGCDVTEFLAQHAIELNQRLPVKAIITDSYTGRTARYLAAFRGQYPVLAMCYDEHVTRLLALSYGVKPIYLHEKSNSQAYFFAALRMLLHDHLISENDLIAYLSGSFGEGGGTTFLEINKVKDIFDKADKYHLPNFVDIQ